MSADIEIAVQKQLLRNKLKTARLALSDEKKKSFDSEIATKIISSKEYMEARTVICYVSGENEIDTRSIIGAALANKKRVAVPKTEKSDRTMKFYVITSFSQLEAGNYKLLEPIDSCILLDNYTDSICIAPALGYDLYGHRIGYGKGFYDKFLADYTGISIGLCYTGCVGKEIPHEEFDVPVDVLVTQNYIRHISR